jgi:hypothetical protein
MQGVGEAFNQRRGNDHGLARWRQKYGDVESPWVKTRISGVGPLSLVTFFAAAGGKESDCRPAQGQRPRSEALSRMPAKREANPKK